MFWSIHLFIAVPFVGVSASIQLTLGKDKKGEVGLKLEHLYT